MHPVTAIGLAVSAGGLVSLWQALRRKRWHEVDASVERRPSAGRWGWDAGSPTYDGLVDDYWAIYTYKGVTREARLREKFHATAGPFIVWRAARPAGTAKILVNPHAPDQISMAGDFDYWPWLVGLGVGLLLAGLFLGADQPQDAVVG
ncbi:MAG: hypothetical protein JNM50_04860 [Chromatiales bacterium]|nr:hypothetical protein [Chromatiales bacterium]